MPSARSAAALLALALVSGCADLDTDVTTSPTAHETPPLPPPPLSNVFGARFLGGSGLDLVDDVQVGNDGHFYIVGGTASPDFPVTVGGALNGDAPADCPACPFDGFVARVAPTGSIVWARLIQSGGYDRMSAVAVGDGAVWVAGSTGDRGDGPGFHGGVHPERGAQDGILCKLAPATGEVVSCRYVGGSGPAGLADLALAPDLSEVVVATTVVAGEALHLDPAYVEAFAAAHRGTSTGDDGLLLAFAPDDLALRWATYVGGSGAEGGTPSVARDDAYTFYLGETTSTDAPTDAGFQTAPGGGTDAYLAAFSDRGGTLRYASYAGGSGDERVSGNALLGERFELYVGLTTTSDDMPEGRDSPQPAFGGNGGPGCGDGDMWIARLQPGNLTGAASLPASRYFGGAQGERFGGFDHSSSFFDGSRVVFAGQTFTSDLPIFDGQQGQLSGGPCTVVADQSDAFVGVLTFDLTLVDSTYLGRLGRDAAVAVSQLFEGPIVAVGNTEASQLPEPSEFDDTYGGNGDGFMVAYHDEVPAPPPPPPPGPDSGDVPSDYDESAGCCGTSGAPGGNLALGLAALAFVLFRRRRGR